MSLGPTKAPVGNNTKKDTSFMIHLFAIHFSTCLLFLSDL